MLLFNSEMHLVTFIFVLLELMMLACQLFYYYSRPQDKRRLWYLLLLVLLIFYNLTSGFFPDPGLGLPVVLQNILAYGGGFLMAAYFPLYFYKNYNLAGLRFHALYGVPLFLLLPYLAGFVVVYPLSGSMDFATSWGMVIPFVYSLVLLWVILQAIRAKVRQKQNSAYPYRKGEMLAVYSAVTPWVCMSVFSYLHVGQWVEAVVTNLGFVWVTVLFMARSAAMNRIEHRKLMELDRERNSSFSANCERYGLTAREVETATLMSKGMTYREIADKLFISENTVNTHVQHIFEKTGAKNKIELLQNLGFGVLVTVGDKGGHAGPGRGE